MFCVQIAGVLVAIENRYAFTERLCADYIVDVSPDECDFSVSATAEEIAAENNDEGAVSPAYCESLALYRKMCTHMLGYDAFLFHAAVVSYAGRGYAFAAKSGTGKSTHVAQWMRALGASIMSSSAMFSDEGAATSVISPALGWGAWAFVIGVSVLSGLYPAYRAMRLSSLAAIRNGE